MFWVVVGALDKVTFKKSLKIKTIPWLYGSVLTQLHTKPIKFDIY